MNDALKTIFESAEALNENGLQVLALIAGVIRQVAPSSVAEPAQAVALPETSPLVEPVELPETPVAPSPLPETKPAVALPETAPSVAEPAYRFVLNVPEIKDYKEVK